MPSHYDQEDWENWSSYNKSNDRIREEIKAIKELKPKPYSARLDVIDKFGKKETHYIGDKLFIEPELDGLVIESAWSDFSSLYRQTHTRMQVIKGVEYSVTLRRKLTISNGKLLDISDVKLSPETADGQQQSIVDPFLLHVLKEKRSETHVTNIIKSIQENQDAIIEAPLEENMVVQGCAGSGKTMILLHRLSFLMYRNPSLSHNSVCIVGPNPGYKTYFSKLSDELGVSGTIQTTLMGLLFEMYQTYRSKVVHSDALKEDAWINNTLRNTEDPELAAMIHSPIFRTSLQQYCKPIADEWEADDKLIKLHSKGAFRTQRSRFFIPLTKYQREVNEIDDKRKAFFANGEKTGLVGIDAIAKLTGRKATVRNGQVITAVRLAQLLYLFYIFGPLPNRYRMLCFDEAQDIAYPYWLLIHGVYERSIYNIYGDTNQTIYPNSTEQWAGLIKMFGAKNYELKENYRNSTEIVSYYNEKLGLSDVSMGLNIQPVFEISESEFSYYLKMAVMMRARVAVISDDDGFFSKVSPEIGIRNEIVEGKVSLFTVPEAKGLEFDIVFLNGHRMASHAAYIGMTRALSELYIVK
jgi:DNA helicase IV